MILEYMDFKEHVNKALDKFNAKLDHYKTVSTDGVIQYYNLPSGIQLILHARLMSDGGRVEFHWEWVL